MNRLIALATIAALVSTTVVHARDLRPDARIGSLFCYEGWNGDTDRDGHIVLTDRPMRSERRIDEGSSGYHVVPGTKWVDIDIEHFVRRPGWDVRYNDAAFYRRAKAAALRCVRIVYPHAVREHSLRLHTERLDRRYHP